MTRGRRNERGYTLIEVVLVIALASALLIPLGRALQQSLAASDYGHAQQELNARLDFAMRRMERHVRNTGRLILPLADRPSTSENESERDPGVLAVTMSPTLDRNWDGVADADNDGDGRVDEDLPGDNNADGGPGILGIDDNNNGDVDPATLSSRNDDEYLLSDEDPLGYGDADGDGTVDDDMPADMNADSSPGWRNFDDDGDGSVDEGNDADDDEDGLDNEDWYDTITYFLSGTDLIERMPNVGASDGTQYTERVIASDVAQFLVRRETRGSNRRELVTVLLRLQPDTETRAEAQITLRAGGPS